MIFPTPVAASASLKLTLEQATLMTDLHPKPALVSRPTGLDQLVARCNAALGLQALLELALGVQLRTHLQQGRLGDAATERARRVEAALEKDGRHERLHGVRQHVGRIGQARRFGAAPEPQRRSQVVLTTPMRQRLGAHQLRAQSRQRALVGMGLALEQQLSNAEAEHRVAQKLHALIVAQLAALVRKARVGERFFESRRTRIEPNQGGDAFALLRKVRPQGCWATLALRVAAQLA